MKRLCPGAYVSVNTDIEVRIERNDDGTWQCSYGDYSGSWGSLQECRSLIESNSLFGHETYPIKVKA